MARSTKRQTLTKKAARARKLRAAGKKAAATLKRKAATRKAVATQRQAAEPKAAETHNVTPAPTGDGVADSVNVGRVIE